MGTLFSTIGKGRINPYLLIAVAAMLAYLPVSSMLFALRNDVVAIEYPIRHFMSECIRNGVFPTWFNTWSMGFPLQSVLSWGVFSTPAMVSGLVFEPSIYLLHAEFVFYIMAAGWGMFKLLKTHFVADRQLALLLSCCYMLSGFTCGSSQWLLYITGMSFMPLTAYFLLSLIKTPGYKYALLFAVSCFLFFTNVHIYLTAVFFYSLSILIAGWLVWNYLFKKIQPANAQRGLIKYLSLAILFSIVLCAAPAYYTFEVVTHLERSIALAADSQFFQSNFLHPNGLSSLLFPLSSVKAEYPNTEGTILNTYIGLLPLLLLPVSIYINIQRRNKLAWLILIISISFLLFSFGHLTPFRGWLNLLPGMAHFRHPGVLRLFFIISFIGYIAISFRHYKLTDLFITQSKEKKIITVSLLGILIIALTTVVFYSGSISGMWKGSVYETVKTADKSGLIAVNAIVQSFFILAAYLSIKKKQEWFSVIIITELIVNTLICTPFFTVSSYTAKQVNTILSSPEGFHVQQSNPFDVNDAYTDDRNNTWQNINTFRKEVSVKNSLPGPLILESLTTYFDNDTLRTQIEGKRLVFIRDPGPGDFVTIEKQKPNKVIAKLSLELPKEIMLQQVFFPGWKIKYNDQNIIPVNNDLPFISVVAPAGKGNLEFTFEKKGVIVTSLLLHVITMTVLGYFFTIKFRRKSGNRIFKS